MARASSSGLMDHTMRESGTSAKLMEKERCITQMAIFMRVTGSMIKPTARASTLTRMAHSIQVLGVTISSMALAGRLGPITRFTRESTTRGRRTALESSSLRMALYTRVHSK